MEASESMFLRPERCHHLTCGGIRGRPQPSACCSTVWRFRVTPRRFGMPAIGRDPACRPGLRDFHKADEEAAAASAGLRMSLDGSAKKMELSSVSSAEP